MDKTEKDYLDGLKNSVDLRFQKIKEQNQDLQQKILYLVANIEQLKKINNEVLMKSKMVTDEKSFKFRIGKLFKKN